jgi:glycosyltransferase involved in cell wall biosynthesis
VIHWSWNSTSKYDLDLRLVKFFKKKRFIEWVGSEMRIPEITMLESKWYKEIFNNGYEYSNTESREASYHLQEKFAKYGFVPVLVPEMHLFLKPGLFKTVFTTQYRIFQKDKFPEVFYPDPANDKIVIVHSPSAKFAKGSGYIITVVEKLKTRHNIEFILLNNVPHPVVLETMKRCDIFIDQIILGSYAAAAIEAMSLGKPTVAYIMPSVYNKGIPADCPIVNANPDTLEQKLTELITDPELRYNTGIRSRRYVEEVHNADTLALQLLEIYNSDIEEFK